MRPLSTRTHAGRGAGEEKSRVDMRTRIRTGSFVRARLTGDTVAARSWAGDPQVEGAGLQPSGTQDAAELTSEGKVEGNIPKGGDDSICFGVTIFK